MIEIYGGEYELKETLIIEDGSPLELVFDPIRGIARNANVEERRPAVRALHADLDRSGGDRR
jgi:hypothetical protein